MASADPTMSQSKQDPLSTVKSAALKGNPLRADISWQLLSIEAVAVIAVGIFALMNESSALRNAVTTNALTVHYQPKVDLTTGLVQGVEALVRWHHAELGTIGPDEFIPLAEHSSLITPLTMFVLRNALRDCAAWRQSSNAPFTARRRCGR